MGLNIETLTHKRYQLTFWDVGGQATKLWKHYFDKIDGVAFVIDSTDEEKLLFATEEFARLLSDESLLGIPFLLLYNKSDLPSHMSPELLNTRLDVLKAQETREVFTEQCSAVTGEGVWEGIDKLIAVFENRRQGKHLFPQLAVQDHGKAGKSQSTQ